ncbi:patatin-domain-containing protein [Neolentinus lepideus HHB14362 ss-1]|uniref:Lysophospholipase NTE1 n=1 Tax=Neolentinus lepideus HHB14362 ss-1 TaxID=1314782 RepID=A0A165WC15_9AGAM|nr:patatin-domain-containing protein [Neolentinus lepideus HHB14362 ss-1]
MDPPGTDINERHPLVYLISACFWVILWVLSWVKAFVAFATITVPRLIYSVLSYSMTLTLNFWSFAILFAVFAVALNFWIRVRYLNRYATLKEPPLLKPDAQELHPDVNTPEPTPAFHNYLDEFLQAVRVFGFLEKPVFHELARHLQTRRLIAGDSLSLDQDKSFYCVVDGTVQVYAQTGQHSGQQSGGSWDEDDTNGYQLLNEVKNGGTLSSLFTILSLFTEDVKMSWENGDIQSPPTQAGPLVHHIRTRLRRANSDVSQLDLTLRTPMTPSRRGSISSTSSTVHPTEILSPLSSATSSHPHDDESVGQHSTPSRRDHPAADVDYGVVARAVEDSTLAVIPAEAFRRLTKKFPKATAHIVQVILTRFSRVTFNAAHKYLGLTSEVLLTEKAINDMAGHPLPASFYEGGGLQYLRQRFDGVATTSSSDTDQDYFSNMSSSIPVDQTTQTPLASEAKLADSTAPLRSSAYTPFKGSSARQQVQPGDLHSSTLFSSDETKPPRRNLSVLNTPYISRRDTITPDRMSFQHNIARLSGDDFDLREEVMSCIAKSIGLLQPPLGADDSLPTSPAMVATEGGRSRAGPLGPFGSLTLLDMGDDVSSMTGGSTTGGMNGYSTGLDNEVEILYFAAGTTLVKAGETNTGLFYVIEGILEVSLPADQPLHNKERSKAGGLDTSSTHKPADPSYFRTEKVPEQMHDRSQNKPLFTVKPGGIAGYLASLCNISSYIEIKAKTDTYVGFLPSHALDRLIEKRPIVLLTLAKRLISLLSPLVLHLDSSLDWMQIDAGHVLWRAEEISDSFYIVINGRLRAITEKENGVTIVGEYGQGDTVGELDVITSSRRRTTVHAIRDTELIRMPQTLFNAISTRSPKTTSQILRTIASRVRDEVDSSSNNNAKARRNNSTTNLKTLAILPVTRTVPVEAFARKLQSALEAIGAPTSYLNQASVSSHLGRHAFTRMGKLKAAGWLADQEQRYRIVLYVADSTVGSPWTQTCIHQADCVMVVGMGDDPSIGEYERLLLSLKTTARKELVLLHAERFVVPGLTRQWLKNRPWVHQHIHIELPGIVVPPPKASPPQDPAAVTALKNLKDRVQSEIQKYRRARPNARPQRPSNTNDFARLARRICGKSIGLVLGGGGARGMSHIGVIQALEEFGIPIDHVAGTSIGSFIGGLYAREGDIISTSGRAKQFSGRMSNIWRMLSDVTYPIVAYTTGHEFNRAIYKVFYDLHIEDMWLPYFCNTTNITTSRMQIHDSGYAWRFIRASMTLVGLLPPLVDNGDMLVDGGYVDNLPVDAMFAAGASAVFAVDVGAIDDNSPRHFGDTVSGWWLLVNRWNPFSNARTVPAITEIQSRLAYVSSVKTLEEAKATPGCLYMQMPVQEYGTLQFGKFEEIKEKGYHSAMAMLEKFDKAEKLPSAYYQDHRLGSGGRPRKGQSARRNSI